MSIESQIATLLEELQSFRSELKSVLELKHGTGSEDARYLTRTQVAKYLSIGISTVDYWCRTGKLKKHKHGKSVRFDRQEIDAWMGTASLGKLGKNIMS